MGEQRMVVPTGEATRDVPADKLRVFISYSRDDIDFADQLDIALKGTGFNSKLDRHSIAGADDWKRRLGELILEADTVVFVLSPSSANSPICVWEVTEAVKCGKRIVPVLCRPLDGTTAPQQLSDLNYIHFFKDAKAAPQGGFGFGLMKLVAILQEDPAWMREHTRLLGLASQWESAGRPAGRLLSGDDIPNAKAWLTERRQSKTEPTDLHLAFIRASEEEEARKNDQRRHELEERERLVRQNEAAQADRAAAMQREIAAKQAEVEASNRVRNRTRLGLVVATALALIAGWFGYDARQKTSQLTIEKAQVEAQKVTADLVAKQAREREQAALLAQSKYLKNAATADFFDLDSLSPTIAAHYALEALRDERSDDPVQNTRPYYQPAEQALHDALRALREGQVLSGHTDAIRSLIVLPGGHLASGSDDRTVRLWNPTGRNEPVVLHGHKGPVVALAMLPDGRLATGAQERDIRLWDLKNGGDPIVLKGHVNSVNALVVLPDGRIASGSGDRTIRLWDVNRGGDPVVLRGHESDVTSLVVLNDGRLGSGSADKTIRIWNLQASGEPIVLRGHSDLVLALALLPDGRLASGAGDRTIRLWDLKEPNEHVVLNGNMGAVHGLVALRDGRLVSTAADKTVRLWDLEVGRELAVLKEFGWVYALAVLPNDRLAIGAHDRTIRQLDLRGGELTVLKGHKYGVNSLAVLPDGRLASGAGDKTIRIWNLKSIGEPIAIQEPADTVTSLTVLPDGRLASTGHDRIIRLLDPDSGSKPVLLKGHTDAVYALTVLPDGRLASGGYDRTVRIWDPKSAGDPVVLKGPTSAIVALAVLQDGRLVSADGDGIRLWDIKAGGRNVLLRHKFVTALAVLTDGRIASGGHDGVIRLWDLNFGDEPMVLHGHTERINSLVVLTDGRLASGADDRTIRLWDIAGTGQSVLLKGHSGVVKSLIVLPDGRLASGSVETIALWDILPFGQRLIDFAKERLPRCLTDAERRAQHLDDKIVPSWCHDRWPYRTSGLTSK